jgi:IS5 family transposase
MYRMPSRQMSLDDFFLPFEGELNADNRWVKLAQIIPWEAIEEKYAKLYSEVGTPAKPIRMALGALIIKERCKYSDEELVEQITENLYLQYFIGLKGFQKTPPFDPSSMVHWRQRFTREVLNDINEMIFASEQTKSKDTEPPTPPNDGSSDSGEENKAQQSNVAPNKGKLLVDATCAPADIRYPTDLSLLNEAREKLEGIIDTLHQPFVGKANKPRTYRQKARKAYLSVAKQKRPHKGIMRKAIGKQLRFVARNLKMVDALMKKAGCGEISARQQRNLEVIRRLYEQQATMHRDRTHTADKRIVSIHQPHVRPIVRGKSRNFVEFGAKVEISLVNGYTFMENFDWEAFNENAGLQQTIERYHQRYGYYPEAVLADRIYRTRENLQFCKEHGIRLSGPRLGRPSTIHGDEKRLELNDARERNAIEGKFGEGKRRYGLNRIMAKLKETAGSVIAMQFLVMNLEHRLRVLLAPIGNWIIGHLWAVFRCIKPIYI